MHSKRRHYWIVVLTVYCNIGEVKVHDSLFTYSDKEMEKAIFNLFQWDVTKMVLKFRYHVVFPSYINCGDKKSPERDLAKLLSSDLLLPSPLIQTFSIVQDEVGNIIIKSGRISNKIPSKVSVLDNITHFLNLSNDLPIKQLILSPNHLDTASLHLDIHLAVKMDMAVVLHLCSSLMHS